MKQTALAETTRLDTIRLCHSGLDSRTLRLELLNRLQRAIAFDYAYFSTTDPATQFGTSAVLVEEPPSWLMSVFLQNEFLQEDFNKFGDMLSSRQSVSALSEATGHELDRSPRYRDMLAPLAMKDELRAILVSGVVCWGTLCLHRGQAYSPAEADYLAQLVPHMADGLRKALLLGGISPAQTPEGSGVLILSEDLSIVAMTAAAEYWLMELNAMMHSDRYLLPFPVRSVIAGLQGVERGTASAPPKVRMRTRSGQWLILYASRLRTTSGQAQMCVMFEVAQPLEMMPLILQAYNLTRREGEITQCVLRGWSTTEIAANLHISPHTVQDHLKAIFEKADVGSRGELAARIFTQQYQSQFAAGAALDTFGQFSAPPSNSTTS